MDSELGPKALVKRTEVSAQVEQASVEAHVGEQAPSAGTTRDEEISRDNGDAETLPPQHHPVALNLLAIASLSAAHTRASNNVERVIASKTGFSYRAIAFTNGHTIGELAGNNSDIGLKLFCAQAPVGPELQIKLKVIAPPAMKVFADEYHVTVHLKPNTTRVFDGTGYVDQKGIEITNLKVKLAMTDWKAMFARDGILEFYVRDGGAFQSRMLNLWSRFLHVKQHGPSARLSYPPNQHWDTHPTPQIQAGALINAEARPPIQTFQTFAHPNLLDLITRKLFAVVQSMEFDAAQVADLHAAQHKMKFLSTAGGGTVKYFALLDLAPDMTKRLAQGDRLQMRSGEIAVIVSRPKEPFPRNATPAQRREPREYLLGKILCGDGIQATDELLRKSLDRASAYAVKLKLNFSDVSFRCQI
ncbi:MAG: hypothetical protein M1818_004304 [Claussenomyces sp. TS43310]|nr:MAG: hypothetical protein M1818_004304 [Claussenomyces sp. TS43310]